MVVTRFAPSPTGHLHIGGARTAIFSWLLAKHFGGTFRLRIEDTDIERSKQEYTDSILASMSWLGLNYDADLVYQTQRTDRYNQVVDELLASGNAYYCNCTVEEVEAMREEARLNGTKPKYNGKCRNLGLKTGNVVRLKARENGEVAFNDLFKGYISTDLRELDDMILRRSDGMPTYNLAVVVDDHDMGVTHVVRGDDHVANTPKQILIYEALAWTLPTFAHVPMILGADGQKLSKRHGARAVIEYEQDGLLPEALVNYLVRLGWSCGDEEIFSLEELIAKFNGTNLNPSASRFDPAKLEWLNAHYIKATPIDKLSKLVLPFVQNLELSLEAEKLPIFVKLYQERASNLNELAKSIALLLSDFELEENKAINEQSKVHVANLIELFQNIEFEEELLEQTIHSYVEQKALKFKEVGPALRYALTKQSGGPSLAQIMLALGKEESLRRLKKVK